MTTKRTTQDSGEDTAAVTEEVSAEQPVLDFRKMYEDQIKNMQLLMEMAAKQGITLGETPPTNAAVATAVREVGTEEWVPSGAGGPDAQGNDIPWSKFDLNPTDKYNFVPQLIPGLVHPVLDQSRRPVIFFTVNGLQCCLTVGVLNMNVSGMFYWAYMNAEQMFVDSEEYKNNGPKQAPWVGQGPFGTNTWHHEAVAPQAWIDLDGKYYTPGAVMPIATGE